MLAKSTWKATTVVVLALGLVATGFTNSRAEEAEEEGRSPGPAVESAAEAPASDYWIGVALDEGEAGLRVMQVVPGGPADRAGMRPGDVLVSIEGRPVNELPAVIAMIDEHQEKQVELIVRRGDRDVTIQVRPERRPVRPALPPAGGAFDARRLQSAIEEAMREGRAPFGAREGDGGWEMWRLGPGFRLPAGLVRPFEFPRNLTVTASRGEDDLVKVHVEYQGQSYDVTEKNVDELPEEVRPIVQQLLGTGRFRFNLRAEPATPPDQARADADVPGDAELDSRRPRPGRPFQWREMAPWRDDATLDEIRRELRELRREIQELRSESSQQDR